MYIYFFFGSIALLKVRIVLLTNRGIGFTLFYITFLIVVYYPTTLRVTEGEVIALHELVQHLIWILSVYGSVGISDIVPFTPKNPPAYQNHALLELMYIE